MLFEVFYREERKIGEEPHKDGMKAELKKYHIGFFNFDLVWLYCLLNRGLHFLR